MTKVDCGIVTFNPDVRRLEENLKTATCQVDSVFLYDNGSANFEDIKGLVKDFSEGCIELIDGKINRGMAVALNVLCRKARSDGAEAIFLLDQDSVSAPCSVEGLLPYLEGDVGVAAPFIVDRNAPERIPNQEKICQVKSAITSGSLLSLAAHDAVGGYDERLFVDLVDYDFCLMLQLKGYRVLTIPKVQLLHEIGNREFAAIFPTRRPEGGIQWKQYRSNHSAFRRFDMARSWSVMKLKYRKSAVYDQLQLRMKKIMIKALVCEKDKVDLVKQFCAGWKAGKKTYEESATY